MDAPFSTTVFALALARMLGVALAIPNPIARLVGHWRFRIAFAGIVALMITPVCQVEPSLQAAAWPVFGLKLANEFLVGLVLGVGVHVLFAGVQVAAQLISSASGLSLGGWLGGDQTSAPLTRLLDNLSLAIFLVIGGHRMVMEVVLSSLRAAPVGLCQFQHGLIDSLAALLSLSFALGLRAAIPVLASLMLAVCVVGVLARFLPRFQMFVSSASLNSVVLFGALFVFMGTVGWTLQDQMPVYLERLVSCMSASY